MSKESQPPAAPPSNDPVVREVKPVSRSRRPPLFQEFLANFKGGTALEQALAEQAQREQLAEKPGDALLGDQSTGLPVDQATSPSDDQTINLPGNQTTNAPDNQTTKRPTGTLRKEKRKTLKQSGAQSTSQPINQSTNQPVNQSTSQPDDRQISRSADQATDRLVDQSISQTPTNDAPAIQPEANRKRGDDLLGDQSTGRLVDQEISAKDEILDRQGTGDSPVSLALPGKQINLDESGDQATRRPGDQATRQPVSESVAGPDEEVETGSAPEHTYPSRVGKVKIGVWLPERQVERMKMWCLLHKTPMQDIIQQAVAEWWEKQPEGLVSSVESALQTLPAARQSSAKKRTK